MTLRVIREPSTHQATLGSLYIDGHWQCFTLEDVIREQPGVPVANWKVQNETAIPSGRYRVIITPSARFKRPLPRILDVPGFDGIRIHPGNTNHDTDGCLLVGQQRGLGMVDQSVAAFDALFPWLQYAHGDIWIEIVNPQMASVAA